MKDLINKEWHSDTMAEFGWVIDSEGNYIAEIVHEDEEGKYIEDEAERIKNLNLMAAAPALLKSLIESAGALKDIINAADNGQPYTAAELLKEFGKIQNQAETVISELN